MAVFARVYVSQRGLGSHRPHGTGAGLNRTKMSAQLTLAGLWHSAGPQQWNPELWQRFPLHSETLKRDSGSTSRLAV